MTSHSETTTWAIERARARELFDGASPYEKDDDAIAAAFHDHPAAVLAEIARIGQAFNEGKIHTPWRLLASRLSKLERDEQTISLTADLRIRQAENWIRNAGIHCPTPDEVRHELFHSTAALLAGLEHQLADRMLELWRTERPRGRQAEAEQRQRGQRVKPHTHCSLPATPPTSAAHPTPKTPAHPTTTGATNERTHGDDRHRDRAHRALPLLP